MYSYNISPNTILPNLNKTYFFDIYKYQVTYKVLFIGQYLPPEQNRSSIGGRINPMISKGHPMNSSCHAMNSSYSRSSSIHPINSSCNSSSSIFNSDTIRVSFKFFKILSNEKRQINPKLFFKKCISSIFGVQKVFFFGWNIFCLPCKTVLLAYFENSW